MYKYKIEIDYLFYLNNTLAYNKMVKNTGGNKSKKQARKTVGAPTTTQNVRYVKEVGEMYAVITKIYGGKTCQVMCDDGVSRRCTIRRKFMMSRRGDNALALGTWLMAGLYDWEKRADGSQTCDILEVYSAGEREKLKQTVNAKILKHIMTVNNVLDDNKNGSEFVFSDTLADIANAAEEEDDTEEEEEIKTAPIIPLKELLSVKNNTENLKDQMDWVNISLEDI
jgi:hypothetical protein